MTSQFQRFSAIQYYLAHARNTVHAIAETRASVSEDAFHALVAEITASAPQLLWRESLVDHGHTHDDAADWRAQCRFTRPATDAEARAELHTALSAPLHDTNLPAFRALCQALPDGGTRITLVTTHALMEGGDVADLLRGRRSDHRARPITASSLSWGTQLGALALAPMFWTLNLLAARFEKKDRTTFGFAALRFDRGDLKRVAQDLGLSQRDLVFALVSHHRGHVPGHKKKLHAAFSSRPSARVRLCDDEVLSLRMDDFTVAHDSDFATFAKAIQTALRQRGTDHMFVQTWHRRLNQIHRFLHPRLPWLYPPQLFGFAPYDVVLSLLPPVRTSQGVLKDAVIYAGSDTGTAESCIFTASAQGITVTLWSGPERDVHMAGLERTASDLGISTSRARGHGLVDRKE